MKIFNKIKEKIRAYFYDEYEVTIWYVQESLHDIEGNLKMCKRAEPMVYNFSKIKKKSNTHIIGVDMEGKSVEIITNIPFDYKVRKLY